MHRKSKARKLRKQQRKLGLSYVIPKHHNSVIIDEHNQIIRSYEFIPEPPKPRVVSLEHEASEEKEWNEVQRPDASPGIWD